MYYHSTTVSFSITMSFFFFFLLILVQIPPLCIKAWPSLRVTKKQSLTASSSPGTLSKILHWSDTSWPKAGQLGNAKPLATRKYEPEEVPKARIILFASGFDVCSALSGADGFQRATIVSFLWDAPWPPPAYTKARHKDSLRSPY